MSGFDFKYSEHDKWRHKKCDSKFNNKHAKQSPINIDTGSLQECHTLCSLELKYKPNKCKISKAMDNVIKIDYDNGSYIKFNNNNYELKYIQFHTPGLHTIDFNKSEMEILLYHSNFKTNDIEKDKETIFKDKLKTKTDENHSHVPKNTHSNLKMTKGVIISILVNFNKDNHRNSETKATLPNQFIGQFIRECDSLNLGKDKHDKHKEVEVHKDWNVNMLLPKKKTFYTYEGSLPYPPCDEDYKWIIFEDHIQIINEFVHLFKVNGNSKSSRQLNPLNNRLVFYNNNVELQNGQTKTEKKEEEIINKNELVKNMLAPIRIQVNDIEGLLYEKKSKDIIASYYNTNRDYDQNEHTARRLSKAWDDAGRIGYEEVSIRDIKDNYEDYIFDREIEDYPELVEYVEKKLGINTDPKKNYYKDLVIIIEYIRKKKKEKSQENSQYDFNSLLEKDNEDEEKTNLKNLLENTTILDSGATITIATEKDILIYEWYYKEIKNKLFDLRLEYGETRKDIMEKIIEYLESTKDESIKNLYLKKYSNQLNTTLTGKNCQNWGSNKVHYEGNPFNLFRPNIKIPDDGLTWADINSHKNSVYIKKMIRDGLLEYNRGKWYSHNNCRNPNNSKHGSWCYTTDPKTRWDYCIKPNYNIQSKKYILIFLFFFIIFLAYYMVKLIFRFELFTQFMSRITGTKYELGGDNSSSNQPTP